MALQTTWPDADRRYSNILSIIKTYKNPHTLGSRLSRLRDLGSCLSEIAPVVAFMSKTSGYDLKSTDDSHHSNHMFAAKVAVGKAQSPTTADWIARLTPEDCLLSRYSFEQLLYANTTTEMQVSNHIKCSRLFTNGQPPSVSASLLNMLGW